MHKIKTVIAVASLTVLGFASAVYAADTDTKQPMDQAVIRVDKNLEKNPDSKGLNNAAEHLQTNQERQAQKRAEQKAKREAKAAAKEAKREAKHQAKHDKHGDKMEGHEADHADKMHRPEKSERPEKTEHKRN